MAPDKFVPPHKRNPGDKSSNESLGKDHEKSKAKNEKPARNESFGKSHENSKLKSQKPASNESLKKDHEDVKEDEKFARNESIEKGHEKGRPEDQKPARNEPIEEDHEKVKPDDQKSVEGDKIPGDHGTQIQGDLLLYELKKDYEGILSQNDVLKSELEKLAVRYGDLEVENGNLTEANKAFKDEKIRTQRDRSRTEKLGNFIESVQDEKQGLIQENRLLEDKIKRCEEKATTGVENYVSLEQQIQELLRKVEKLETEKKSMKGQVVGVEKKLSKAQETVKKQEADLVGKDKALAMQQVLRQSAEDNDDKPVMDMAMELEVKTRQHREMTEAASNVQKQVQSLEQTLIKMADDSKKSVKEWKNRNQSSQRKMKDWQAIAEGTSNATQRRWGYSSIMSIEIVPQEPKKQAPKLEFSPTMSLQTHPEKPVQQANKAQSFSNGCQTNGEFPEMQASPMGIAPTMGTDEGTQIGGTADSSTDAATQTDTTLEGPRRDTASSEAQTQPQVPPVRELVGLLVMEERQIPERPRPLRLNALLFLLLLFLARLTMALFERFKSAPVVEPEYWVPSKTASEFWKAYSLRSAPGPITSRMEGYPYTMLA
ncbi:hypothetical protein MMC21_004483 [Puttea exsequens]|nr:hypothetical protein [Puttea exsequens]